MTRLPGRPLVIGIGGGGDVVGALIAARTLGLREFRLGGMSWERRTWDPLGGPRAIVELLDAQQVAACAALAGPRTRNCAGLVISEARMSEFIGGEPVVVVDPGEGPALAALGMAAACRALGCDGVLLVDVGGDALARGDEPGLVSPLCDAIGVAAAKHLTRQGLPVVGALLGAGCDGELTLPEVEARLAVLSTAEALLGRVRVDTGLSELERAAAAVRSQASALVIRCARGEVGVAPFRDRTAVLSAAGAVLHLFDLAHDLAQAAPLAASVARARSIEEADAILRARGCPSELGRQCARWVPPPARRAAREARRPASNAESDANVAPMKRPYVKPVAKVVTSDAFQKI